VIGDWNMDGTETVGMFNDNVGAFHLRNANSAGVADVSFFYGPAGQGWTPLAGVWRLPAGQALQLDGAAAGGSANQVTNADLAAIKAAALAQWAATGLRAQQRTAMAATPVVSADLQSNLLAWYENGVVYIDQDAAGQGWFVDSTPGDNSEYQASGERLLAVDASLASGDVDLLSVLSHELGLVLGEEVADGEDVMNDSLPVGVRRLP
jgi:hypothetical protein